MGKEASVNALLYMRSQAITRWMLVPLAAENAMIHGRFGPTMPMTASGVKSIMMRRGWE